MFGDARTPALRDPVIPSILLCGMLLVACGAEPGKELFQSARATSAGRGGAGGAANTIADAGTPNAGAAGGSFGGAGGAAGNAGGGGTAGAAGAAGTAGVLQGGASPGGASPGGAAGQAGSNGSGGVDCGSLSLTLGALKSDAQFCEMVPNRVSCAGFVQNHCGCKLAVDQPESKVAKDYAALAELVARQCAPDCSAARLCTNPTSAICKVDLATRLGRCESAD